MAAAAICYSGIPIKFCYLGLMEGYLIHWMTAELTPDQVGKYYLVLAFSYEQALGLVRHFMGENGSFALYDYGSEVTARAIGLSMVSGDVKLVERPPH